MAEKDKAIIGRIPGYNSNIDVGGKFEKELLKGVTYVDLFPTAYTDSAGLFDAISGSTSKVSASWFGENLKKMFQSPGIVRAIPSGSTGDTARDPSMANFTSILTRIQKDFDLDPSFSSKKALRLIAANDSTFTETFTNTFGGENAVATAFGASQSLATGFKPLNAAFKGLKSLDSNAMLDIITRSYNEINAQTGLQTLGDLMTGAALGMNIATPSLWSASQYNSTLTLFIKLVSPTGQPECIKKNILEPLMYIVAASSPMTSYGTVYGYPMMWQVHAHGITNFRLGSIAALSIIRGSFETTFTKALQPTIIDIRLTLIPLLTDFAVQLNADNTKSIYQDNMAAFLGVQNPADIVRGTMNKGPMGGRPKDLTPIVSVKI